MKKKFFATFKEGEDKKTVKYQLSDEWVSVQDTLQSGAVFKNPKVLKLVDPGKNLPNILPLIKNRSCLTVMATEYDVETKKVGAILAQAIILIQGSANDLIFMLGVSNGYSEQQFYDHLNAVLKKV